MLKLSFRILTVLSLGAMFLLSACGDDDETPPPVSAQFSSTTGTVGEDNATGLPVTVNLSGEAAAAGTVTLELSGATYGTDYTTSPDGTTGSITLDVAVGSSFVGLTVLPVDNDDLDGDKTVTVTISAATGGVELGSGTTFTVTIEDNEGPTAVNFAAAEASVSEDGDPVTVTLNLASAAIAAGSVDVTITSDAAYTTDYTTDPDGASGSFTVAIDDAAMMASFTVTPVDNDEADSDRVITFTLGNPTGGIELGASQTTYVLTITSEDLATISIANARGLDGDSVVIQGIVTTPDYGFSSGQFYVQDETAGINVFFGGNQGLVQRGDRVQVFGDIGSFSDQVQISPDSISVISSGNALPSAADITESNLVADDALQGSLVTISNVMIVENDWPIEAISSGSGLNVSATVGSTDFDLRIDRGESFYDGSPIPGEPLTVTGILARNNDDVQIFPFVDGDIVAGGTAPTFTVTESLMDFGQVANGNTSSEQSYTVAGDGLDNDVTISVSSNYEISLSSGADFSGSVTLTPSAANAGATIFVRFVPTSGVDQVIAGAIIHSSDDFKSISVDVSGEETGNGAATRTVKINEFHYDNTGGDTDEFVEIVVTGEDIEMANLSNYRIILYNGSDGNYYTDGDLSSSSDTFDNFTRTENSGNVYYVWEPSSIQNGNDGIALVGPSGLIEFISYEGSFTANEGPAQGVAAVDVIVSEPGTAPIGSSIQRKSDNTWEYTEGTNTKGAKNPNE